MLVEWYVKMCNEHPMLEYLEDPLVEGDAIGYQKILKRFKDACPRVKVGVKSWFKSNIDNIKTVSSNTLKCFSILKLYQRTEMMKKRRKRALSLLIALGRTEVPLPGLNPHQRRMINRIWMS